MNLFRLCANRIISYYLWIYQIHISAQILLCFWCRPHPIFTRFFSQKKNRKNISENYPSEMRKRWTLFVQNETKKKGECHSQISDYFFFLRGKIYQRFWSKHNKNVTSFVRMKATQNDGFSYVRRKYTWDFGSSTKNQLQKICLKWMKRQNKTKYNVFMAWRDVA